MARPALELASTMAELPALPTHYEQLGVAPTATMDAIRAAYQAWLAAHTPVAEVADAASLARATPAGAESQAADPSGADPLAEEHAAAKRLAHVVLSDPLRRRVYDAFLVSQARVVGASQRWWRRASVRRGLAAGIALLVMVGSMAAVGWLILRR